MFFRSCFAIFTLFKPFYICQNPTLPLLTGTFSLSLAILTKNTFYPRITCMFQEMYHQLTFLPKRTLYDCLVEKVVSPLITFVK